MTTKQEKIIEKMTRAQKPAVGDGSKAFKSLTAAVRAAEKARNEARASVDALEATAQTALIRIASAQCECEWKLRSMQTRCRACSWVSIGAAIAAWVFFVLS